MRCASLGFRIVQRAAGSVVIVPKGEPEMVFETWKGWASQENLVGDGLAEWFTDLNGVERLRLTPAGARAGGREDLAVALEKCKEGEHTPFLKHKCACGESQKSRLS